MTVCEDALGTVRGRLEGAGKKRLLIGSHIDTVIDAGKYDGPFGVIAGILAAEHFRGKRLPFGIDVLAFGDEEGSRFPATLSSSSACAGIFRTEMLDLADRNGVTLARRASRPTANRRTTSRPPPMRRDEAAAYVEVHIEQGPVLEARKPAARRRHGDHRADLSQRRISRRSRPRRHGADAAAARRARRRRRSDAARRERSRAKPKARWSRRSGASRSRRAPPM